MWLDSSYSPDPLDVGGATSPVPSPSSGLSHCLRSGAERKTFSRRRSQPLGPPLGAHAWGLTPLPTPRRGRAPRDGPAGGEPAGCCPGGAPGTRPSKSRAQAIEAKGLGGHVVSKGLRWAFGLGEWELGSCPERLRQLCAPPDSCPGPRRRWWAGDPQMSAHRPLPRCPGVSVDSPGAQAPLGPDLSPPASPKPWPQAQPPERRPQRAK